MSRVSKNRNYKDSVKDLDSVLEMNLRQWMSATPGLLEPEVQRLLEQMHEFARQIQRGGFAPAVQNLASDVTGSSRTVDLTELIADSLCRTGNSIKRKSLQETLYYCTGIAPELLVHEFGKRFESFLALSGSKGLIRIFLSLHLSNLILTDLHDSMQASTPEEFCGQMEAIERICQEAAAAAVRSVNDWLEPDQISMATLLLDLKAEMARMLSNRVSLQHGA